MRSARRFIGWLSVVVVGLTLASEALPPAVAGQGEELVVNVRFRKEVPDSDGTYRVFCAKQEWDPRATAIIICDMWNQHWCKGATRRVAELAPVMDRVVSTARAKGVLIIHAPSGTIKQYENHPARQRAKSAPKAANLPQGIASWCHWKDETEKKVGYPIDHSDGGCDCRPPCEQGSPWRSQIDSITIHDRDAISDSGVEIWNLLEDRGIENVILMGVHTNMCVLGRPFGLRQMAKAGKNVVLMRDLTDTMYNSRRPPHVSHFTGTDLIVEHIEKYVCPTVTSTILTGGPPFRFKNDQRPLAVFISAESEYEAAHTLPGFAHELELDFGLRCEILQGSAERKSADRHDIAGMEILSDADLVVVFVRRRAFPAEQMRYLRDYLNRGGPLIGLRTASHAFDTRGNAPPGHDEWRSFDPDVFGGNYHGHHGSGPTAAVTVAPGAGGHAILKGVELPLLSNGSLYETRPLAESTTVLLTGTIPDKAPEPVAWTNRYKRSRIFYTSLGHPDDFENPAFRKLLVNAVFWALGRSAPQPKPSTAN